MSDEQRVRTMCGWVGVEISKSRKRRAGDPETGMYRVRTAAVPHWHVGMPPDVSAGEWTEYLFTLEAIEAAVAVAISGGTPDGPQDLVLHHPNPKQSRGDKPAMMIPTRWTSRYQGRRDLGVEHPRYGADVRGVPYAEGSVEPWAWSVGAHWVDATTTDACEALLVRVVDAMGEAGRNNWYDDQSYATRRDDPTPRQRQRAFNAQFHAEHLERRKYGLRARYAAKDARARGTQ